MSKDKPNKIKGWGIAEKFIIWTMIIVILLDILTAVFMPISRDITITHILIEGVLGVFMIYIVGNYLTRPIRTLLKGVEEIASGNLEYKIEPGSTDEIYTLSKAFNQMSYNLNKSIGELRTSEEKYRESEKKYRTLIENIQDGVFIIQDAKIQFSNVAFARIVGYTVEEVIGVDFRELVMPEYLEMVTDRYYRGQAGENVPQDYEFCVLRRDGKTRIVNMNVGLITYRGRVASMGTVKDITEKKMLEMQLLQSDKLATIGHLAAGVAHEINNPLGNISLYTQMLLKKTEDKDTENKLMIINDEANRAAKIVKGLLDFARQSEPKLSHVDINKEIGIVLSIMSPQLKKIKVETVLPSLPFIPADSAQIQQVIMNLLVNSIQAIAENGEITVETAARNDHIEISISDNGYGIPQENIDKIFDPFFTTKGHKGTGLGLSVCYGIIKRHNGSIDVKSEVGKGTIVTIRLPS